jgi:Cu/Ag efflux pump CusA
VPGNEILHVTAAVVLGGLASSTLLILLVLPAIYLRLGSTIPAGEVAGVQYGDSTPQAAEARA